MKKDTRYIGTPYEDVWPNEPWWRRSLRRDWTEEKTALLREMQDEDAAILASEKLLQDQTQDSGVVSLV
jgi:hypothetical protein